tara:strand:- start:3097 stop:3333 length:237 start_codon:yes stop_codon:yes gene_type:complete
MKSIAFLILAMASLSACGTTTKTVLNEWYTTNVNPKGLTSYDPPNGDWIFIRNEPGGSTKTLKRTQDWDWASGKRPQY